MKSWGWGEEGVSFRHDDKPALAQFIKDVIGIDVTLPAVSVRNLDSFPLPAPCAPPGLQDSLEAIVGTGNLKCDPLDRVVHAYGKSLRDLVRIRRGDFGRTPDLVTYPGSEDEIVRIVRTALSADAVVIPFGGGTNIAGCLEAPRGEIRTVISVDLCRMNRVLEIDEVSRLARIQPGALGPGHRAPVECERMDSRTFPGQLQSRLSGRLDRDPICRNAIRQIRRFRGPDKGLPRCDARRCAGHEASSQCRHGPQR